MALIDYDDKDNTLPLSNPRRLCRASDMNLIKAVVNANQNALAATIQAAIDTLVAGAPGALDTLNELAAALADDASFATTVTNSLALKLSLAKIVVGEVPSGTINGINLVFTIANSNPTFIWVYADGIRVNPNGFNVSGTTLTMTIPPDNSLLIDCIKA